jgi:hypothetical protein
VLSRPIPTPFNRALLPDGDQAHRSRHHPAFFDPDAAARLLADDRAGCAIGSRPTRCRTTRSSGTSPCSAMRATMEAALTWYRARGAIRSPLGKSGPHALHLGRRRRHRRARRRRRHRG